MGILLFGIAGDGTRTNAPGELWGQKAWCKTLMQHRVCSHRKRAIETNRCLPLPRFCSHGWEQERQEAGQSDLAVCRTPQSFPGGGWVDCRSCTAIPNTFNLREIFKTIYRKVSEKN